MALTTADFNPPAAPREATAPYKVLRAIAVGGERVEVGDVVQLTRQQGAELASAGKVAPAPAEADTPAPAARRASRAKAAE